jgi:tetratricopeptide (TPR) repeat protein
VRRLASAEQTANPLFLRAVLEELRVFGVHEKLDERIAYYLGAASLEGLFDRILERYEADYERERPGLVREAMTLLWAARRGLAEEELLQVLGDGQTGEPLPQAYWSPLYLAAEQTLTNRSGLIGFFHDYLRQAVTRRYLPEPERRRAAHRKLAGYFAGRERDPRTVDEWSWQLAQAEAWEDLYKLLTDPDFFRRAWDANQFEVKAFWAQIEAASPFRLVEGYRPILEKLADHVELLWDLSALLGETGHLDEALVLRTFQVEHYRASGNLGGLQTSLGNKAQILTTRGNLNEAMALLKENEHLCRQRDDLDGLQASLNRQATILLMRGNLDGALALLKEQECLARQLGDLDSLFRCQGNQAVILQARGDFDGALALEREKERLCRQLGDLDGVATSLGNQGLILQTQGDLGKATVLHQKGERLNRQLGDLAGLARSLGNQALILETRRDLDGAATLLKEAEKLFRQMGDLDGLTRTLGNQGLIRRQRGDLDGAMALYQEYERLCRQLDKPEGLAVSLTNQAELLADDWNRLEAALAMAEEAHQLASRHGLLAALQEIEPIRDRIRARCRANP